MSKNNIIEFGDEVKKLNELLQEQLKILPEIGAQIKKSYASLPSELTRQLKEQNAVEIQAEKLRQESIKTIERLEVLSKKQIQTAKENQRLQVQQTREQERLEKATARATQQALNENSAYIKLQRSWREAQRALADLIVTQGQNAEATRRAQKEFNTLDAKLKQVDASVKNYSRNVGNYKSALSGLGSLSSQLAGALGWTGAIMMAVNLGKSFYDTNKQLQVLNKTMQLGAKDADAYASNVQFLQRITNDYGTELLSTTQAYNKFYIASKNKLALEEIQTIFDKVSKSASLMGISVYNQDLIFKALEQMMSKGTVQAEELRMQLGDHLPGAFEIMANAVGVTTKELDSMMKKGEVITSEVLPKFAVELEKAFGADKVTMIDNVTSAENRMTNAWTNFVNSVDGGDGIISRVFIKTYGLIADIIGGLEVLNKSNAKLREERMDVAGQSELDFINQSTAEYIKQRQKRFDAEKVAYTEEIKFMEEKEKKEELIAWKQQRNAQRLNEIRSRLLELQSKPDSRSYDEIINLQQERERVEGAYNALAKMQRTLKGTVFTPAETESETKQLTDAELKALRALEEERLKTIAETKKVQLTMEIESAKNIALVDAKSYNDRMAIQLKYLEDYKGIVKLNYDEEVRQANGNKEKLLLAEAKYNAELQKIADEQYKITEEAREKQYKDAVKLANMLEDNEAKNAMKSALLTAKTEQDKVQARLKYIEEQKTAVDRDRAEALRNVREDSLEYLIIWEEFEQKKRELDQQTNDIIADQAKKAQEKIKSYLSGFTDMGNFGFSSLNIFTEIEENGKTAFENLLDNATDWKTKIALIVTSVGDVFKDVMNIMQESSRARFENEMKQLELSYETNVLFAGESKEAKEKLEQEFEEKQRELRIKQAKRDKQMAIMNAVINTAQGVVSMLATVPWPANFVMAGLVGALGAVQIATIASTPIPEFWTGTDNAPQGWAWTQERGAEVITDEHGNVKTMGNNKGAQLTWLESGDKVFKSQEDFFKWDMARMLNDNGISHNINIDPFDYGEFDRILAKNQSQTNVNMSFDEDGFNYRTDKRNRRQQKVSYNARG